MKRRKDQAVTLFGGKLHVYPRPKSPFYWCGFYHQRKHIRTSTRCADLDKAKDWASQWFFEKQLEIKNGFLPVSAPKAKSFATAAEKALEAYRADVERGTRSRTYFKGLSELLTNRIVPVIGKHALESINQTDWYRYKEELLKKKNYKARTIHQHKIAIRIVLKQAQIRGEISAVPQFLNDTAGIRSDTPRTWFEESEYKRLIAALRDNIKTHKNTRWSEAAKELRDYVFFVANSGLRVGEAKNVRFCDVEITKDWNDSTKKPGDCLLIKNIQGKRGTGECKTYFGAVRPFLRRVKSRGLDDDWQHCQDLVFEEYHRDMFREILDRSNLRFTNDRPPRRRDLMSLRHTYICFRLLRGANVYDIAANCRTSVEMIQNHYAKWLSPSQSRTINRNQRALYDVSEN